MNIAQRFLPVFMMDRKEPFAIKAIGYTLFEKDKKSDSFPKRVIHADWEKIKVVIEYAIWFDYDIQHLYELEHVWVYVDKENRIVHVEGSFHGKYLNVLNLETGDIILSEKGQPVVWMQPGKHAILADAKLVKLVPGWKECCNQDAGCDGLALADFFSDFVPALNEKQQEQVKKYIKATYAFEPSCVFEPVIIEKKLLQPWEQLKESIPYRIKKELDRIGIAIKIKNGRKSEADEMVEKGL